MHSFDVVIVGAGSAGCALAGRLAEQTGLRVALIEAGPDYGPQGSGFWPADLLDAHHAPSSHDWNYQQTRARVVGGCSAHNECTLVRAMPGDYDRWSVPGWTDADLAPAVEYVARRLPAFVGQDDDLTEWQRAFLDAALDAGFTRLADVNDLSSDSGVGPFTQNIKDGIRWNAAFAFLDAVRDRVTVIGDLLADRMEFEGDRARALLCLGREGEQEIRADRFVLCAGVYGSPMILLRSGVGPADHLSDSGIPVHAHLPGVGANLHDHPGVGFIYEPTAKAFREMKQDVDAGRFYEAQVVLKAAPNLHVFPFQSGDDSVGWSFGVMAYYLDPQSRGRMRLTSRDPRRPPGIQLGLLSDPAEEDLNALVEGVRIVHKLTKRPALANAIERGPRRFASQERLARFVRENVTDYSHPVGTCRMGPSPKSGDVVDARGQVYGLANVHAADASIIKRIPRANTNFTCTVIGARLADILARVSA